jgi:hypothetical protein
MSFDRGRFDSGRFDAGPAGASGGVVTAAPVPRDESAAYLDVEARLRALGVFDRVFLGARPEERCAPADSAAVAWVWEESGRTTDESADRGGNLEELYDTVAFYVAVGVRSTEPRTRLLRMVRYRNLVKNALNGRDLGGVTYPAWTLMDQWRDDLRASAPEARCVIRGSFRMPIDGYQGYEVPARAED